MDTTWAFKLLLHACVQRHKYDAVVSLDWTGTQYLLDSILRVPVYAH
jgi:hypothetical protein